MKIDISKEDFATLCICAIRYCHGRKTYMPSLVMEIVGKHLAELSDRDIKVMYDDCRFMNLSDYGDEEEKNSTANKIGNTIKFSNDNKKEETNDLNNKNIEEKNNNNFNNIKYLIGDDN